MASSGMICLHRGCAWRGSSGELRRFELRQVRLDVRRERRVLAQPREMTHGARELGVDRGMQNRRETLPFERADSRLLVEEETHLGGEADVREGDVGAPQALPARAQ